MELYANTYHLWALLQGLGCYRVGVNMIVVFGHESNECFVNMCGCRQ